MCALHADRNRLHFCKETPLALVGGTDIIMKCGWGIDSTASQQPPSNKMRNGSATKAILQPAKGSPRAQNIQWSFL